MDWSRLYGLLGDQLDVCLVDIPFLVAIFTVFDSHFQPRAIGIYHVDSIVGLELADKFRAGCRRVQLHFSFG